jgi:hypothetical protein
VTLFVLLVHLVILDPEIKRPHSSKPNMDTRVLSIILNVQCMIRAKIIFLEAANLACSLEMKFIISSYERPAVTVSPSKTGPIISRRAARCHALNSKNCNDFLLKVFLPINPTEFVEMQVSLNTEICVTFLTFRGPCVVIYSCNKTNEIR